MATFAEYQKQLEQGINDLNANRGKETRLLALDAVNRVRQRVINTGQTATGGQFKKYTPAYAKEKGKTRQVAFRDFKRTNQMWKDITAVPDQKTNTTQAYAIDARLSLNKDLIGYNITNANDVNFLALSDKEIQLLNELNQERFINTLAKNGIK